MLFSLIMCAWYAICDALAASFFRNQTPQASAGLSDSLSLSELVLYIRLRSFFAFSSSSASLLPTHSNRPSPISLPTDIPLIYTSHPPAYDIPQSHRSTSSAELTPGHFNKYTFSYCSTTSGRTSSSGAITPTVSSNEYYRHLTINTSNSRDSTPSFEAKEDNSLSKPFIFDPFGGEEDIYPSQPVTFSPAANANFVFSPFDIPDDETLVPSSDVADLNHPENIGAALAIQVSENVLADEDVFPESRVQDEKWAANTPSCAHGVSKASRSIFGGTFADLPSVHQDVDLEFEFNYFDDYINNIPPPSPVILQHEGTEYTIIGELGRGSFGRVVLASASNGEEVAIKVLSKAAALQCLDNYKTSILNEKKILARISEEEDPFITTLLASFQDEDNIYFVMPRYSKTLSQVILDAQEERFCFSPSQLKVWAAELVLGLSMLDDLHMVHRDLKPDNILVSPTGHLAVADFGFATHFSAKTWPTVKMTQAMGTPGYFAPEMFSKDLYRDGYTSSVDRWGLGMILLEMFSGEHCAYGYSVATAERANEHIVEHVHLNIRKCIDDDVVGDLLHKLLSADGNDRPSWDQVRAHEYFADINWSSVQNRTSSVALPKPTVGCIGTYWPIRVPYGAPKIEVRDASINYQRPEVIRD